MYIIIINIIYLDESNYNLVESDYKEGIIHFLKL